MNALFISVREADLTPSVSGNEKPLNDIGPFSASFLLNVLISASVIIGKSEHDFFNSCANDSLDPITAATTVPNAGEVPACGVAPRRRTNQAQIFISVVTESFSGVVNALFKLETRVIICYNM